MRPLSILTFLLTALLLTPWACSPSSVPPPCNSPADCPNATCDLALGICLSNAPKTNPQQTTFPNGKPTPCLNNTHCPLDHRCKDGWCTAQCSTEDDCAKEQKSCLRARFCGRCTQHSDCFSGLSCQEGRCVPCTQDASCDTTEYCDATTQLCKRRCASNEDCEVGLLCKQNRCVPCERDSDCNTSQICEPLVTENGETSTKLCRQGCRTSQQCAAPTPQCDLPRLACVACLRDQDCASSGLFCRQNACVTCEQVGCNEGAFCVRAKQHCLPNGCNQDGDCTSRSSGTFCDPTTSTCVECFQTEHCTARKKGSVCKQNTCQPCLKDSECPAQQICHEKVCKDQACRSYLDCLIDPNATSPNPSGLRYCSKADGQDVGVCKACALSQSCAKELCGTDPKCKACTSTEECKNSLEAETHCVQGLGVCAPGQCTTWQECFATPPTTDPLGKLCTNKECKDCSSVFGTLDTIGLDPNQLKLAYEGLTTSAPFSWKPKLLPSDTRNVFYQWDVGNPPPGLQYTYPSQNTPIFSIHGTFSNALISGQKQSGRMTLSLSVWQYAPHGRKAVCRIDHAVDWVIWPKLETSIAGKANAHPSQPLIVWRPYERNHPTEIDASSYVKGGGIVLPNEYRPRFRCAIYQGPGQGVVPDIFESTSGCKLKRKFVINPPNGYYGFMVSVQDTLGQKVEVPFLVIPADCSESNRKINGPDPTTWTRLPPNQTANWNVRIEDAQYRTFSDNKICGLRFHASLTSPLLSPPQDAPSSALSCSNPSQRLCVRCINGCTLCNDNLCRSKNTPSTCFFPENVTLSYDVELRHTQPVRPAKPAFLVFQIRNAYNYASQFHCQISLFESPLLTNPSP
ncbi:hypothetical protein L6R29_19075 [Myxococcota bacterium]|nr:hypothetical protein [Myxococcota bacterium]